MMKDGKEQREELTQYLHTLAMLNANGFKCGQEIKDVLAKLHQEGFGFSNEEQKSKQEKENQLKIVKEKLQYEIEYSGHHKKSGKLIRVTENDRGLGKSTLLIEWALRLGIPIITNNKSMVEWLKDRAIVIYGHTKGSRLEVLLADPEKLRGKDLPKGVLVECVVTLKEYLALKKVVLIRGGFHHDKEFI
ncbi:hypothetical protein PQE68_gp224 [Bacillus phage vB_BanS_Sophrita]|uniref:Uncharacterized protein n=1 Tax=Bacillus phage vB_BanS_Sophrita TaxID=2894790 RepID=A0AAE8YUY8_9CAUD|nr:hypothetical protein PQE68_gp224 [Bacillus phage vB_BanS_Sophrita]UGO50815.1 hypothetical protein SOPHRITA_224 [Bacillus phage vB_BanS_Sophrita]